MAFFRFLSNNTIHKQYYFRMSQQQTVQSVIKDFQKRLREDMSALRENFKAIIEAAKCEEKLQLSKTTAAIYDKCQIQSKFIFFKRILWFRNFHIDGPTLNFQFVLRILSEQEKI